MDVKEIIDGVEYDVCCPDSWYIADRIVKEPHSEYELSCNKFGTAAEIFVQTKKRVLDFHDKEHEVWIKTGEPQKSLGILYWEPNTNNVTFASPQLKFSDECFVISYDIIKHLRNTDYIQIKSSFSEQVFFRTTLIAAIAKSKSFKYLDNTKIPVLHVFKKNFVKITVYNTKNQKKKRTKRG